jgi:hypothetical protein
LTQYNWDCLVASQRTKHKVTAIRKRKICMRGSYPKDSELRYEEVAKTKLATEGCLAKPREHRRALF